jgi:hypothetical protein
MCEDFPCCGHEMGDCEGLKYGSDESIKNDPHLLCDHENGECELYYDDYDEEDDEDDYDESELVAEDVMADLAWETE